MESGPRHLGWAGDLKSKERELMELKSNECGNKRTIKRPEKMDLRLYQKREQEQEKRGQFN